MTNKPRRYLMAPGNSDLMQAEKRMQQRVDECRRQEGPSWSFSILESRIHDAVPDSSISNVKIYERSSNSVVYEGGLNQLRQLSELRLAAYVMAFRSVIHDGAGSVTVCIE